MDRLTYWDLNEVGGNATMSVSDVARELKLDIANGGTSEDAIQVVQKGINLLENDEYELTFKARADSPRSIGVSLMNKDGSKVFAEKEIKLTTVMNKQTLTFTMPNLTDVEAQLVFNLGGNNNNVYLDDITLFRLTNYNAGLTVEEA